MQSYAVDAGLLSLLIDANSSIHSDGGLEHIEDDGHIEELLYLDADVELAWVTTSAGYLFRYRDTAGAVWRFRLSGSELQAVCDESDRALAVTRERSFGLPRE